MSSGAFSRFAPTECSLTGCDETVLLYDGNFFKIYFYMLDLELQL